jgi:hypothetical protein
MRLLWLEVKKIITSPAIWGFMCVCIAFNIFLIVGSATSWRETAEPENVFEGYETGYIAEAYIKALSLDGGLAETMRDKYAALQTVVEQKALNGDSLGQYAEWQHSNIFGTSVKVILFEGIITAVLIMLLALGYENINHTEQNVYASKIGRRVVWHKMAAGLVVIIAGFALLVFTAFIPLHIIYRDLWDYNVSSAFNFIRDFIAGFRPFATWSSFTVLEYFWAVIGISAGVVICFSLAAFIVGATIRNSYISFIAMFLGTMAFVFIPIIMPSGNYISFGFAVTPIWLSLNLSYWFTDGGVNALWRNFETWGILISFIILSMSAVLAAYKHKRRDNL